MTPFRRQTALRAATGTVILITLLTLAADTFPSVKTLLANATGHHWVTKGSLAMLLFATLLFVPLSGDGGPDSEIRAALRLTVITLLCSGIILVFYVLHAL